MPWKPLTAALLAAVALTGCSSAQVDIRSVPAGADILTADGELIGKTPLVLTGDALSRAKRAGRLAVQVCAPRHVTRQIWAEVAGDDRYEVKLTPLDTNYFGQRFVGDFSTEVNDLARHLLNIQGMLFAKKTTEAASALSALHAKYQNLVAAHVLSANLEIMLGQGEKARAHLLRALTLDPQDAAATRMLRNLGGGTSP